MTRSSRPTPAELSVVGIDIGKDVFHIVGFSGDGRIVLRRKIRRLALTAAFEKLPRCIVGLEACLSAHFVSRMLRKLGFEPRIIPAKYTKPFVKGQKNDYNDAEGIAEAALRPNLKLVSEKTQDQLDLQALHRVRSRLVSRPSVLYEDWLWLDERIESVTNEIEAISKTENDCERLMSVPGIGPIISTGMVAAIGTGEAFDRGRDFGAWLGLVPRQYSTGGKPILGRISKRGSRYLRTLFVQAAHIILMRPHNWDKFSFGGWLKRASERMHKHKLAVALANKLARIAWSILRNGGRSKHSPPRHRRSNAQCRTPVRD
jgi:transposase